MSQPAKSKWAEWLFGVYSTNLFRRRFSSVRVAGLEHMSADRDAPLVVLANHSSWWDGLVAFRLSRLARLDAHFLMESANLRRYSFFRRLGALQVDLENPRLARRDIADAALRLKRSTDCLWIFPQGKIEPNHVKPLTVLGGAARIVSSIAACETICVAMTYQFRAEYLPHLFVRIDAPVSSVTMDRLNRRGATREFSTRLNAVHDRLLNDTAFDRLSDYVAI